MAMSAPTIAHPPKMPSLTGWWTCCGGEGNSCGREVKGDLYGETCPDCRHQKCESCGSVKQPTPVPEECDHQYQFGNGFHDADLGGPNWEYYAYQRQCGGNLYPNEYPRRPVSFRGWWHCCQCQTNVNPSINDWTCPVDHHGYCEYCYILEQ